MSWDDHSDYGGPKPSWWEAVIFIVLIIVMVGLWGIAAKAQPYKGDMPTNDDRNVYKALVERVVDGALSFWKYRLDSISGGMASM